MTTAPLIISALPTPFDDQLRIDRDAFVDLLHRLPTTHPDVLVAGTTGEFLALDLAERAELFNLAARTLGADRVFAHVGAASLYEARRLASVAAELGIRRVAVLTPYYLPADDRQVIEHIHSFAVANRDLQIYPYLFPDRTGVTVGPTAFRELMQPGNVVGAKLSGTANRHFEEFLQAKRADQDLYTGDDSRLGSIRQEGGAGVVSGCFPVAPNLLLQNFGNGPQIHRVVGLLGPSIARQKLALQLLTGRPWRSRMSMPAIAPSVAEDIGALVNSIKGADARDL